MAEVTAQLQPNLGGDGRRSSRHPEWTEGCRALGVLLGTWATGRRMGRQQTQPRWWEAQTSLDRSSVDMAGHRVAISLVDCRWGWGRVPEAKACTSLWEACLARLVPGAPDTEQRLLTAQAGQLPAIKPPGSQWPGPQLAWELPQRPCGPHGVLSDNSTPRLKPHDPSRLAGCLPGSRRLWTDPTGHHQGGQQVGPGHGGASRQSSCAAQVQPLSPRPQEWLCELGWVKTQTPEVHKSKSRGPHQAWGPQWIPGE